MFKRTLTKFNLKHYEDYNTKILNSISDLKKDGKDLFGAIYTGNKRHTVYKRVQETDFSKSLQRRNAFDYMNNFASNILPKIEKFIETRLIERFKQGMSQAEKELVDDVYRLRRHEADLQISKLPIKEATSEEQTDPLVVDLREITSSVNGTGLKYHTYADIGKYVFFPFEKRNEYFPFGCYGEYMKKEFNLTQLFGIMCREEGIKLAHAFSNIKTHEERLALIDFEAIFNKRYNFKEELKKYEIFSLFYQEIAYSLLKLLDTLNNYEYNYLFTNAEIFDGLVTVLVKNLRKNPFNIFLMCPTTRYKILEDIIKKIHEKFGNSFRYTSQMIRDNNLKITEKEFYPLNNFADIVEHFKIFHFDFAYEDVINFANQTGIKLDHPVYQEKKTSGFTLYLTSSWEHCEYQWRPQEMRELLPMWKGFNSGILLTGEGNGKSMIVAYLHAWAKENNWVVLPVNDVSKYTQQGYPLERHISGLYFQPELSSQFLIDFKIINYNLLKEIPVDLNDYGKYNIVGVKDTDPEPNPVLWDDRKQVYTDSWKEFNTVPEEEIIMQDSPDHNLRIKDILPNPTNLLDIVNAGIKEERLGTSAIAEILNVLRKNEKYKSMFLVDNYNEFFMPSCYPSYKYANYKDSSGRIPPHDIALCRMFMKFDGHLYKQGVKICSITLGKYDRHQFKPELLNFPKGYDYKVDNLQLNDYRNAMHYYQLTKLGVNEYDEISIQTSWQLNQGNWKQMHLDMKYYLRMTPTQQFWMERKEYKKALEDNKKI
jgi:hypothetical protein